MSYRIGGLATSIAPGAANGTSSQDVADTATAITPITIIAGLVPTYLTCDALGLDTGDTFLQGGITNLWDAVTNRLDLSQLSIGDRVDVRIDVTITTAGPNTEIELGLVGGIGGFQFSTPFYAEVVKTASVRRRTPSGFFIVRSASTRDNPAALYCATDGAGLDVVQVNGFLISVTPFNP